MQFELDGEENLLGVLTADPPKRPKRGRRPSVDDFPLINRRDSFLGLIDGNWGRIGWELETAKTIVDTRNALRPLESESRSLICLFTRDSATESTVAELRLRAKQTRNFQTVVRETSSHEERCRVSFDKANAAFQDAKSANQGAEFQKVVELRQRKCDAARLQTESLARRDRLLGEHLKDEQAFVAQTELLGYLNGQRYSFSPLRLANAMAGLPEMGWRQSAERCAALGRKPEDGQIYWLYKLICQAQSESSLVGTLAERLKRNLQDYKNQADYRLGLAKANWYHLRRAIEAASESNSHPRALPYRVLAQYQRHRQFLTRVDRFFEEEEALS